MDFQVQHRTKTHSTNPQKRLKKEVTRSADAVGIFPNEGAINRPIGTILLEANDESQTQNRCTQTEGMAEIAPPLSGVVPNHISTIAACLVAASDTL